MTYAKTNIEDLEPRELDGIEPDLRAVGLELRPDEMRPSVWEFEPGESNERHRQGEQEEIYVVLDGRLRMEVEDETVSLAPEDIVLVPPESWRQLTAEDPSRVLVIGAPNVKDDGIDEGGEEA